MNWDGRNRRKFPRISFPCLIKIRDVHGKDDAMLSHTENLSVGGVRVILKKTVKLGSSLDIEIDLMDAGEHLRCRGKVVWSEQREGTEVFKPLFFDIGIEFVNVSDVDRKRLDVIVGHHLKQGKQI